MIGTITENGFVEKDYSAQGIIFKDYDAFEKKEGICYIPELTGDFVESYPTPEGYQRNERGIYKTNEKGEIIEFIEFATTYSYQDFVEELGGNEVLAEVLFDLVDWQHPSSLIDCDWSDSVYACEECNYHFDIDGEDSCPKCGTKVDSDDDSDDDFDDDCCRKCNFHFNKKESGICPKCGSEV